MKRILSAAVALVALATLPARADEALSTEKFWVAPTAGSLGIGLEGGWRLNEHWGARANVNAGYLAFTYHDKDSDLDSKLKMFGAGLMADYYPFADEFRISAGARLASNRITGKMKNLEKHAKGSNGDIALIIPDPLTSFTISQNVLQPYVGLGYQVKVNERLTLNLDFGALYVGEADLDVRSRAGRFGFTQRQIEREIERARDRINKFQVYPVIQVGFNLKF